MKVCIAGSRDFEDYEFLVEQCENVLFPYHRSEIDEFISGGAKGVDHFGELYVRSKWMMDPIVMRPAYYNYDEDHKWKAPLDRNEEMAIRLDGGMLIAFLPASQSTLTRAGTGHHLWETRGGTTNMIMHALHHQCSVRVVRFPT